MPASLRLKNQHLLWRAGFGPMAENTAQLDSMSTASLWKLLLQTSEASPEPLKEASNPLTDPAYTDADGKMKSQAELTKEQKQQLRQQSRMSLKEMNVRWLGLMINSKAQLREKMSLFWHGHFACRSNNAFFSQELVNIIRTNALGNFGDLLRAVSKAPAMLQFLNNQQNRKGHPNENFAREVMELFTLGRGNYTEADVKEGARAFTGWAFGFKGEFIFRPFQHDNGNKTFLGQTGNFDGDNIIDILLKQKQTARFITEKMFRFFVNEDVDAAKINLLSDRFYNSNYDIKKLLTDIFTADWFYAENNIGNRIKSPVELLTGIRRYLPLTIDNEDAVLLFQKVLGQVLFYPPNVAGWPGGRSWIDSSTLMVRLQIPQTLASKDEIDLRPKGDDDINMGMTEEKRVRIGKRAIFKAAGVAGNIDWNTVIKNFEQVQRLQLAQAVADTLLQTRPDAGNLIPAEYFDNGSREAFVKSAVIAVMSTPEYQLS